MLGLFGTLNLATRSLATQRGGTEVAGHNLANVSNPAYARQRMRIETSVTMLSELGPQGTGADGISIEQLRNNLLDDQIVGEASVLGSLTAQQRALQYAQANLGQRLDRQASGTEGAAAATGIGGAQGIAESLTGLFASFQSLSTNPTSLTERQDVMMKAQGVAIQFNQASERLGQVDAMLNRSLTAEVDQVNAAIRDIAALNLQILGVEGSGGVANDLRDARQSRLEDLGKLASFTVTESTRGSLNITVGGVAMNAGGNVVEQLEAYDPGNGQLLLRGQTSGSPVNLSGGSLQGTIEARDGEVARLRTHIDTIASELIGRVNAIHSAGYALDGSTGEDLFTGTDAASIGVNSLLLDQPGRVQASGVAGAVGDNQVALSLARLSEEAQAGLGGQTFGESYNQAVTRLGSALSSVNGQIDNQAIVDDMLRAQRDSVSGVSLDEEMTDLIRFQRAFQASARLVSTVDEMLEIVVAMKR
ncbi:MAG: flagellar hook-associated protein FlgK [Limisphaerales bacterium]